MAEGRVLGIDYGERRIGVAVSDPLGLTAQGLPTLRVRNLPDAIERVLKLASEYDVAEIVVGLPLHLDGSESEQAKKARRFAERLKRASQRSVTLWDERLTTVQAERSLREMGRSPSRNRDQVNRLAAALLLQNYLDRKRGLRK